MEKNINTHKHTDEPAVIKSSQQINWVTWISVIGAFVIITIGVLFISGVFENTDETMRGGEVTSEQRALP